MDGYVYILQSLKNDSFYIGSSQDPEKRLVDYHNQGRVKYTKNLRPWELVFKQRCKSIKEAREVEYKLKSFKSKQVLLAIIKEEKCRLIG